MTKPFPYQRECALEVERFMGRALVALPMGCGKSLISLLWAKWNPEARPLVIVCPASLKYNWQRECAVHFGWHGQVLESRKARDLTAATPQIWIVNYDVLQNWLPALQALNPKLVILDECAYIKERKAKRSRAADQLCRGVPHVLALSGTPLTNRPAELWHTLHVVRPDLYSSWWPYAQRYTDPKYTQFGWNFSGASNLGELHQNLKRQLLIRRRKEEILPDLPPKAYSVVPLPIDTPEVYEQARDEFLIWLETYYPKRTEQSMKAAQITQLGYLKRLAAELKLAAVKQWVDSFLEEDEGKLILFGIHKPILAALKQHYAKCCVFVDGSVASRDRQLAFDRFNRDPKVRIFLGNIQAAGVGWNGTAASTVAFCELGWTPAEHAQAADRAHRIGQTRSVQVVFLVAHETIEEAVCRIIQRKQETFAQVLDGGQGAEELNVFDELSELVKEQGGADRRIPAKPRRGNKKGG